jgi:hypothetical protein
MPAAMLLPLLLWDVPAPPTAELRQIVDLARVTSDTKLR